MRKMSSGFFVTIIWLACLGLTNGWAQTRLTKEPRPGWVDKPAPGYFIGISHRFADEADSRADALNNAKRQIMESLGGIIESEFIDRIIETDGRVESVDAFTDSRIKVVSKNIINVQPEKTFTEQWREGKGRKKKLLYQTYVAVYFDAAAHRAFMQQIIEETCRLGETQLNTAVANARRGNLFLAIDQIKSAGQHLEPLTEITGLTPEDLTAIRQLSGQMQNQIAGLLNALRIASCGDKQTTRWGQAPAEPLGIEVFWVEDTLRHPLPGLPVEFTLLNGKALFNPHSQTDANGRALCNIQEISSPGRIEFEARVAFPDGYPVAQSGLRITLLPDNKAIVRVIETNLGHNVEIPELGNLLMQTLTGAGFTILETNPFTTLTEDQIENLNPADIQKTVTGNGADLILLAAVASSQPNRIQDGFYFARARGVLKVYSLTKQAVVGNYLIEDKNAGNTPENAGMKAIKKVSDALIRKFAEEIGL